jgi:hypothetical protein
MEDASVSLSAQILLKQVETLTAIAALQEQMKAVPDHEQRIRALERRWYALPGSALAAAAAAAAAWLSYAHR